MRRLALLVAGFVAASAFAGLPPSLAPAGEAALRELASHYGLAQDEARRPIRFDVVATAADLGPQWNGLPRYAAGAAVPAEERITIILDRVGRYPFGDAGQTLRHELSHVLLRRRLGFAAPRWLDEGLALRMSGELSERSEAILLLPAFGRAATLDRLESDFVAGETDARRSYALARGFTIALFPEPSAIAPFLARARALGSADRALFEQHGLWPAELYERWLRSGPSTLERLMAVFSDDLIFGAVALIAIVGGVLLFRRRRREMDERFPGEELDPEE